MNIDLAKINVKFKDLIEKNGFIDTVQQLPHGELASFVEYYFKDILIEVFKNNTSDHTSLLSFLQKYTNDKNNQLFIELYLNLFYNYIDVKVQLSQMTAEVAELNEKLEMFETMLRQKIESLEEQNNAEQRRFINEIKANEYL